ncbi:MAG: hypothetical protein AAF292_09415 [Pseudomonadota bacterium]
MASEERYSYFWGGVPSRVRRSLLAMLTVSLLFGAALPKLYNGYFATKPTAERVLLNFGYTGKAGKNERRQHLPEQAQQEFYEVENYAKKHLEELLARRNSDRKWGPFLLFLFLASAFSADRLLHQQQSDDGLLDKPIGAAS